MKSTLILFSPASKSPTSSARSVASKKTTPALPKVSGTTAKTTSSTNIVFVAAFPTGRVAQRKGVGYKNVKFSMQQSCNFRKLVVYISQSYTCVGHPTSANGALVGWVRIPSRVT